MNRFLKFIEISFFILINILFTFFSVAFWLFLELGFFFAGLSISVNKSLDFAEDVGFYAVFVVWNLYIIAKIVLFPILYNADKKFPNVHKFFDLFYAKKIIHRSILIITFLLPLVEYFICLGIDPWKIKIIGQLLLGYGVFPSYLIMYFYLKRKNSQKFS